MTSSRFPDPFASLSNLQLCDLHHHRGRNGCCLATQVQHIADNHKVSFSCLSLYFSNIDSPSFLVMADVNASWSMHHGLNGVCELISFGCMLFNWVSLRFNHCAFLLFVLLGLDSFKLRPITCCRIVLSLTLGRGGVLVDEIFFFSSTISLKKAKPRWLHGCILQFKFSHMFP